MCCPRVDTKSNYSIFHTWASSKYKSNLCNTKIPVIIRENLSHLVIFNGGSSYQDVSKIIGRYTDDVKNASMVINSYLRKNEFIVFDLTRSEDDPLAIRLRFDTPLDLQKEIELRQKKKIKSEPADT